MEDEMRWLVAAALGSAVLLGSSPAARGENGDLLETMGKGFTRVAHEATPAVVFISVEKSVQFGGMDPHGFNDPYGFFGDEFLYRFFGRGYSPPRRFRQSGQGSGFIISKDGYILTNNHVVGDSDEILVRLHDGREFKAKLIGSDPHSEVAVIKIDGDDLPVLPLGNSEDLEIGEWVLAIGNPFGLSATLTAGVVSAKGRSGMGIADYENFIQTDAAINPGNSGGPLLNTRGEAVGINTAIFSRSGGYMGIGFAIPINMARDIQQQLVEKGRVDRGFIGIVIQDMDGRLASSFGMDRPSGIIVVQVTPGSAGEKAGLAAGDVILKLNGRDVTATAAFRNEVANMAPGTDIRLDILRDDQTLTKEVTIGRLDSEETTAFSPQDEFDTRELGISVDDLTPDIAQRFGYENVGGVIITEVQADSIAERAGLQPGHVITSVNRKPVANLSEFRQAIQAGGEGRSVLLLVTDGQSTRFVALPRE